MARIRADHVLVVGPLFLYSFAMWREYNPNPAGRRVGDCTVRAISKALDVDWETAFKMLVQNSFEMCDMPSSDAVWGSLLRQHGYYRFSVPNYCPECYTAEEFAADHPEGVYVVGFGGHVATIKDGTIYDSFDSSELVPIYYWHRPKGGKNNGISVLPILSTDAGRTAGATEYRERYRR